MTAKEYLEQVKLLDMRIQHKMDQLDELRKIAALPSAISYDKDSVVTSPTGDTLERAVLDYLDLSKKIDEDIDRYVRLKDTIIDEIDSLRDAKYVSVLYKRYVEFKKIERIACEMDYDYAYVRSIHCQALKAFAVEYKLEDDEESAAG